MPALERALALAERQDVAVGVADDLDLDVPRAREVALEEHPVVAEARGGLAARGGHRRFEVLRALDHAHPAPAAARRRLDQHGVFGRLRRVRGDDGHARRLRRRLRAHLVAHQLDRVRRRPDEHDTHLLARAREGRVLAQEPVARVHRVAARRHDHDLVDRQIRGHQLGRVGLAHVRGVAVGLGVDRHRADAEPVQRPQHPAGDLAAVRDEHGVEHQAPSARAMTICCTSSVPSPMVRIFASRYMRQTGYSSM